MSSSTSSGVQRQRQNAYDVGTNKHNQYGLKYGYSVNPDPNDPYGWQAYEAERAMQKKWRADRRAAAAASRAQMQHMASAGHSHSSGSSSSSSVGTSSSPSSASSFSASTCSSSPAVKELKKKEKAQRKKEKEARRKQQKEKKKKKKAKCSGSACRLKSLSIQRPAPHWCDGKNWGGKIWGFTRDPGDKNPGNWGVYFDPKLSRSEVIKICRRRCPAPKKHHKKHHKTIETKVVLTRCCHGPDCPQCQQAVSDPAPVPVPGMGDAGVNFDYGHGYGAAGPRAGGMPVNLGPGPSAPPHAGYSSHPAGNVERWRVHTSENTKKTKSKSGSNKSSSKKGSKSSSDHSSKNKSTSYTASPEPENRGFDNRFLYAGTEYGNDSGVGAGVRAGGNYARNGPVPIPGASFLNSISPHLSDDTEDTNSPPAEVEQDTQEDSSETVPKSSKAKGKMPVPSCWVESASSSTVSFPTAGPSHESGRESRFDRFRSRQDDSGRLREGSWERVSPQVQRQREWQRIRDEERGRRERKAEAKAEAEANANAEQGYDAHMQFAGPSNSSGNTDRFTNFQVNVCETPARASFASGNSQSDYLTMGNSSYFAHVDNHPKYLREPTPGSAFSMPTTESAPGSASCPAISSPYSISGDTGYETGHEADNEANRLPPEMQVYQDPGYKSMSGSAGNYENYGSRSGAYHGYGDGAVWGELDSSSSTLLSSSAWESAKERTCKEGQENGKSRGSKKGKSDKKSRSETSSSSSSSTGGGSRASRRSKKPNKNDGGLLAKIVGW